MMDGMRVLLDDEQLEVNEPTVAAALTAGVERAGERGRVIIEVLVNDRVLNDEELAEPSDQLMVGSCIELKSASPGFVVVQAMHDSIAYLERVRSVQVQASELIQSGQLSESVEQMGQIVGIWQTVQVAASESIQLLEFDLTSVQVDESGTAANEVLAELTDKLAQLKQGLISKDWSSVSDILEYDLDEQIDRFSGVLGAIAKQAEQLDDHGTC